MKKQLLNITVAFGITLVPLMTYAEEPIAAHTTPAPTVTPASPTTGETEDMSKTHWLNTIVPMLPSLICKGFMGDPDLKQRLDTIKMNYDQCVAAIPESVSKCQNQLDANIPDKINNEAAATWGKSLGECIGKDFAMKYLLPKQ